MANSAGRWVAIDVVRGCAIVSMVVSHLHGDGAFYRFTHLQAGFDGASGFVLLSGLVLGMVQHRRLGREGLPAVQLRTARRLGLLYASQVGLGLLALLVIPAFREPAEADPRGAVLGVLALRVAPSAGNILRMYVVFFLLAIPVYVLLAAGRTAVALLSSLAVYLAGAYAGPAYTTFSGAAGGQGFSWAGWQLLFFSALALGWHWRRLDARAFLSRRRWQVLAGTALGLVATRLAYPYVPALFAKSVFAPGRILVAYLGLAFLVVLVDLLLERLPGWPLRPLAALGRRSLDCYLWQALAGMLLLSTALVPRSALLAWGTLGWCWGWAEARAAWTRRRAVPGSVVAPPQPVVAGVTAPDAGSSASPRSALPSPLPAPAAQPPVPPSGPPC